MYQIIPYNMKCQLLSLRTVNMRSLLAIKLKGRVVKCIEHMRCRAVRFARGDGKFAANAATPLQYASARDSPPHHHHIKTLKH